MFPYPQRKYPQIHPLQKIKGVRQLEQAGEKRVKNIDETKLYSTVKIINPWLVILS